MRVFLDANVLFSAAYREKGSVRAFFILAAARACTLVTSAHAAEEARRNLAARHPDRVAELEKLLGTLEVCPEPRPATLAWASTTGLPQKDAPILAAAVDARCAILATGDRSDFGTFFGKRMRGTVVLLPAEAIDLLLS
jgi:predicted nucleic acid-binding protein